MIHYIKHKDIDKVKWDLCIEQSLNPMVYACSWFLDKACANWDALVMDDYRAIMPLPYNKKYFISYVFQPLFAQQLGIFAKHDITQEMLCTFIQAIPKKYKYTDIYLNEKNQIFDDKIKTKKRKNFLLNLNQNYNKLQKNYNLNTKRNLKKSKRIELEIKAVPYENVIAFYKQNKGLVTKGVKDKNYENLKELYKHAQQQNILLSKGVFNKSNEMIACACFFMYKNRITYSLGTASDLGREYSAMYLLFDHIIFLFSDHSMYLDFEGSDIENIARFFKGFGSEKVNFYRLQINRLPFFLRWLKQ